MMTTPAPMSPAPPLPDGVVPASGARRLGAFLIDAVLITVAYYGITAVALAMGLASGSIETLMTMTTVSGLIVIALVAAMTAWLWTRGYTPGHRLLGLRWAAWDGAGPAGARSVGWYALAGLVGTPTLGVVPIITLLVTDPQGRNWIDRVCGTVVVIAGPAGPAAPRSGPVAVPGTAGMSRAPGAAGPVPAFVEDTQEQPALTASQLRDRLGAAATAGVTSGPFAAPAATSAAAVAPEPIGDGPLFAPPPAPTGPAAAPGAGAAASPPAPAVGAGFISSVPWETPAPAAAPAPTPAASASATPAAMPPVPPPPAPAPAAPPAPGAMPPVPPPPAARRLDRDRAAMPPVPPPPAVPEAAPAAAPAAAIDEGPTVARTALPRAGATLVMDTGQRIALVAPRTLLGRAPVAVPPWDKADTVPVIDPDRSISKTHLAVLLDGDRLSVRELGSTNGSAVVAADGARTTLLMGQDVVVPDGARVELGDRSFTVER